jgi:hypothetical protein
MKRIAAGEYATPDGRYRVVARWGDGRLWCLLAIGDDGTADILSEHRRLKDARRELERKGLS